MLALVMTQLTQKGQAYVWDRQWKENFQELKKKLTTASMLILPNLSKSFVVFCDAFNRGLGGVIIARWSSCNLCFKSTENS